ncbi:MAG: transcription termination factor Rho [Solirubrobacteraceae bacterium]|jgi:transcription termination factor Rho|nr:transcription termination factor Rho [Solirubrobacteraceae bacterium]
MSSVLDPSALAESPLADLHLLANELGVDGYRRLRKADLIDAIVARQAGEDYVAPGAPDADEDDGDDADAPAAGADDDDDTPARPRRGRRGGRGRARRDEDDGDDAPAKAEPRSRGGRGRGDDDGDDAPAKAEPRSRGGRGRARDDDDDAPRRGGRGGRGEKADRPEAEDKQVEGTIELLGNGSAFVRLTDGETSDDDVYVSAAQVKRCELVSGDKVAGPMRPPRRSERFPSLVRVDTINGKPADEVSEGTRFDDLPVIFPAERLALGSEDPTVKAIEWLTPFGKGSRVTIVGPARAGKSEALRRIAAALAEQGGTELSVVLAGVRPEEVAEWPSSPAAPATAITFAASSDAQGQAIEQAVEQARRVAARGADAVVIIDSLEYVPPAVARRALAAARNIADGGSLTVIATAPAELGGETTVIALDAALTAMGRFPALDLASSGTMRPELLVGEAGAEAIAKARADTLSA